MLDINTNNHAIVCLGNGEIFDCNYPKLYINEVKRDEKSNSITATAYDKLSVASELTIDDLDISAPYSILDLAQACATLLGLTVKIENVNDISFDTTYEEGGNFEPSDTIRYVLNAIAEATQTIYFINNQEQLVFKRLDKNGEALLTITKDDYYELNSKTNKKLTELYSVTELGDNYQVGTGEEGAIQYVRDNPLWELRTDIDILLESALAAVGGISIHQFTCDWAGDYRLEIGDKIALVAQDNSIITSYLLSDSIDYAGTLSQITNWEYTDQSSDTLANPTNIGDKINQTYARVDKVNKEIELVVGNVQDQSSQLTQMQLNIDGINTIVADNYESITNELNTKVTATELTTTIKTVIDENGINKVETVTGYTLDENGLTVSKSDSEMSTIITDNGMTVSHTGDAVLIANNHGVQARDLQANTYLIIGENTRFENIDSRTCCFWIGE